MSAGELAAYPIAKLGGGDALRRERQVLGKNQRARYSLAQPAALHWTDLIARNKTRWLHFFGFFLAEC